MPTAPEPRLRRAQKIVIRDQWRGAVEVEIDLESIAVRAPRPTIPKFCDDHRKVIDTVRDQVANPATVDEASLTASASKGCVTHLLECNRPRDQLREEADEEQQFGKAYWFRDLAPQRR